MSFADLAKVSGIGSDPHIADSRCMWLVTVYGQIYIDVPLGAKTNVAQDTNIAYDTASGQYVAQVFGIALQ